MSKFPPPPGAFSPPPGFKAPAGPGAAKFPSPAPTNAPGVGAKQPQSFTTGGAPAPVPGTKSFPPAPNFGQNNNSKAPVPAPSNQQQQHGNNGNTAPSPMMATNNINKSPNQQHQQPIPQAPSSNLAAKFCPAGAQSPSAPSSINNSVKSQSSPATAGPMASKFPPPTGNGMKAPAPASGGSFPAPNKSVAPAPFPMANKFPAPNPAASSSTHSNSAMSSSLPRPPSGNSMGTPNTNTNTNNVGTKAPFPAPNFAGPNNNTSKFPAPAASKFAPPPGSNQQQQQQQSSSGSLAPTRQPSTALGGAPSPSPARPPQGFPQPPGQMNNNNMKSSMPAPFPGPGGPKTSFPPPGGKGGFPQPPGFNTSNNNNSMMNQQPQPNMNQQQQSTPTGSQPPQFNNNNINNSNTNINNNNNTMRSGTPTTPSSLSYSSPVTTGTPQHGPNSGSSSNQQQQNQQSRTASGNNSFNQLPSSQLSQQQQNQQGQNQRSSSNQQQQNQNQNQGGNTTAGNVPQTSGRARMRPKPQGQNRIDSLQMPSPCRDLIVDGHPSYNYPPNIFATSKTSCPPTAASGTPCIDEGNCLPKFIRPTMHQLPWDEVALDKAKMPWGAVLSPLCSKSVNVGGSSLPVVNTPGQEPVRCSRCRAYMTSWNPFAGTGHSWVCAFCGMSNEVSEAYFSPITTNGKRRDYLDRPELCRGSYEVDVSGIEKYFAENPDTQKHIRPKPMNHLFIIDVSANAQNHIKSVVSSIRDAVDQMPTSGYGMCSVSFVTYASTLHFYDFSDPKTPMMVVPDVDNPFVPLPFNLLCWMNVEEQRERIDEFLDKLESGEIVRAVDETGCVLGAAAKVGQLILSDVGGMVIMTGTSMPTAGCGIVPERDSKLQGDPKKEPELFKPQPGFWPNLASESAKRFVSFTLIMFPSSNSCDMITVGQLPHLTGGKQWTFSNFREESDGLRLKRRIVHALNDEAGYGAILRTRCSAGVRVKAYHGHFMQTDPQDMDLAVIDSHSSFYVQFNHDGKLERKGAGIVQVALLYTTRSGHRRVRVHNLRMTVADTISTLFRYTDLESTIQAFISLSIHEAFNKGVKAAREWITARTVELLVGYRVHSQSGSHSGQLLLPENLKLLPLYNLCLLKSDALVSGTGARFEDRVQNMFELLSYPQDVLLFYLYPRLFGLHHLPQNTGEYKMSATEDEEEETEVDSRPKVFLPGLIQLTADNVYQGGVYLLQDLQARVVFLVIGSQVAPQIMQNTFGTENIYEVNAQSMDNWNSKVRRIVQQLVEETGRFVIVKEKMDTSMEDAFFRNLLEDEGPGKEACYSEYLCSLHKQINQKAKNM